MKEGGESESRLQAGSRLRVVCKNSEDVPFGVDPRIREVLRAVAIEDVCRKVVGPGALINVGASGSSHQDVMKREMERGDERINNGKKSKCARRRGKTRTTRGGCGMDGRC